jgi:hypothetical protein
VLDDSVELLKPGGAVVITLADAHRYRRLIAELHGRYDVERDTAVDSSTRRVIVLHGRRGTVAAVA